MVGKKGIAAVGGRGLGTRYLNYRYVGTDYIVDGCGWVTLRWLD